MSSLTFPFLPTVVSVAIPQKFRKWFSDSPQMSVQLQGEIARINSDPHYQLRPVAGGSYAVLRPDNPPALRIVGQFDALRVHHTLNNRFLRDINLIRSAVYDVHFPAPIAYVLRDYSLIHPGPCFDSHKEIITLKALYSIKDEDARCCVCKEPFI
jgi:hypothetical protein